MRSEATSDGSGLWNSGVVFLGVPHEAERPEDTGEACCQMAAMSAKKRDWSSDDRQVVGRQVHSICTGFENCAAKLRVVSVTGGIPSRKSLVERVKKPLVEVLEKCKEKTQEKLLPNGLSKASSPSHDQSDMADTRPPVCLLAYLTWSMREPPFHRNYSPWPSIVPVVGNCSDCF
jgi:hypothetical protein